MVHRSGAAIGANASLLPGDCTGERDLVAAGAIVTRDIPDRIRAIGAPAKNTYLPEKMVREETKNNHEISLRFPYFSVTGKRFKCEW